MIDKKLVDEFIDEIKDDYSYKSQVKNGKYTELNIYTKDWDLILSLSFTKGYSELEILQTTFYSGKEGLIYLHNLTNLLMLANKMFYRQREIDAARRDAKNARKHNKK